MKLTKRLEQLEAKLAPNHMPKIIFIQGVHPNSDMSKTCALEASYVDNKITIPTASEAERMTAFDRLEAWVRDCGDSLGLNLVYYRWVQVGC